MFKKYCLDLSIYCYMALLFCLGCTAPYDFEDQTNEDVIIVDGMITNQVKKHQIRLSRSYPFEANPIPVKGADVRVISSDGTSFSFVEKGDFLYEAAQAFGAAKEKEYRVLITTREGKTITSTPMRLPPSSQLEEVFARATFIDNFSTVIFKA